MPAVADLDATLRVDVRATLPAGIEQPGDMIGRYRLIEPLGQGGFGSVWRAEQHEPIHREVALKVIKAGMDSREIIARFEAERQALALMDHPNIAAVLDAGTTESGRPFFAMELVKGVPITDYCDAQRLGIRQRLELFIPVCQAVQHAHQKSILHRDLKPSNILVMEVDGKAVPKVIDFGIAKALRATNEAVLHTSLAQTIEGIIVGTPQYMSPEQAGSVADVDTRSDIYTLGVILYELLTGSTPLSREQMKQAALDEVFRCIRESEPRRPSSKFTPITELAAKTASLRHSEPRKLGEALKGDLDWIVMRTLEKDRERRYETANALALELGRHLNNEPVLAGPPSVSYRLGKFVRRQKGPLSAAAALFVVSLAGTAVSWWQAGVARSEAVRATQAEQTAKHKQTEAETATALAEARSETIARNLYFAEMNLAGDAASQPSGMSRVVELTEKWRPRPEEPDRRGWEWHYLGSLLHEDAVTLRGHALGVLSVDWSPDGKLLATGSVDRTIRLWDATTFAEANLLRGHKDKITMVAWSPDSRRLASCSTDHSAKIWDAASGTELVSLEGHTREVRSVSWSPDGMFLATGAFDGSARIWDSQTGRQIKLFGAGVSGSSNPSVYVKLLWRPDGGQLALLQDGKAVRFLDSRSGAEVKSVWELTNLLSWSPDGKRFASAGASGVRIRDGRNWALLLTLPGHDNADIRDIRWSPDGSRLASAGADHTIKLWDATKGTDLATFRGHLEEARSVAWSPDGKLLASVSLDNTLKIWNVQKLDDPISSSWRHMAKIYQVAWSPDGSRVATLSYSPTTARDLILWDPAIKEEIIRIPSIWSGAQNVSWNAKSSRLAAWSGDHTIKIWDAADGTETANLESVGKPSVLDGSSTVEWSPNGKFLASGGRFRAILVHNAETGAEVASLPIESGSQSIAWNPAGNLLAAAFGRKFAVWNVSTWQVTGGIQDAGRHLRSIQWSPDGCRLATGGDGGTMGIWNVADGFEKLALAGHERPVNAVTWSPDGKRLASASLDRSIRLWDAESGAQVLVLKEHTDEVRSLAWSPDGTQLISGGVDRMILWDASKSYELERERQSK